MLLQGQGPSFCPPVQGGRTDEVILMSLLLCGDLSSPRPFKFSNKGTILVPFAFSFFNLSVFVTKWPRPEVKKTRFYKEDHGDSCRHDRPGYYKHLGEQDTYLADYGDDPYAFLHS